MSIYSKFSVALFAAHVICVVPSAHAEPYIAPHISKKACFVARHILPVTALIGGFLGGLYTLAVFVKSPILPPAARLLLTPVGAGAVGGAMLFPYLICERLALKLNIQDYIPSSRWQFFVDCQIALKRIAIVTGVAGAGICIAALCGEKHAKELIDWAEAYKL